MKIFVSYAAEDREAAEEVAHSVRGRGHTVFLDRSSLPPGGNYEQQIENAIRRSSLMVFLITTDSIAEGRFTLTELKMAQEKWRSARDRVLPVMLRPTPYGAVPSYLRAVTIMEPKGNAPAEIAQEIDRLARRRARVPLLSAVGVASFVLVLSLGLCFSHVTQQPDISLSVRGPEAYERGFFGSPDLYQIGIVATNEGSVEAQVRLSLDVEPEGALIHHEGGLGGDADEVRSVGPGAEIEHEILVSAADRGEAARWRACVHAGNGSRRCTAFLEYIPEGEFPYGDTFEIDEGRVEDPAAVAWDGNAYLVADGVSGRIVRVEEDGRVSGEVMLEGVPTTISVGSLGVFVGMVSPDRVARIDSETLDVEMGLRIEFPNNSIGDAVSTRPASLAQDGENLWLIGRGGPSANGLGVMSGNLVKLSVPPYYEDIAFDLPGMTLRNSNGHVWSGERNVTPASILRLSTTAVTEFGGHEYDIAACASDVMPVGGVLIVLDCDGIAHVVSYDGERNRLDQGRRVGDVLGYNNTGNWQEVVFGKTEDERIVTVATVTNPPDEHGQLVFGTLGWEAGDEIKLHVGDARLVDMAVGASTAMLIVENRERMRELVVPSLD